MPLVLTEMSAGTLALAWIALVVVLWFAGSWIASLARPAGHSHRTTSAEDLALMSGGPTRLAETATVTLLARGELEIVDKRSFARRPGAIARSTTEAALLDCAGPASWSRMRAAALEPASAHDARLAQLGLAIAGEYRFLLRLVQAIPLMILTILLALTAGRGGVNADTADLVGPLAAVTALLVLARMAWFNRLTEAGKQVLDSARKKHQGLSRAFVRDDAGLAVALFGPGVLAGSSLAGFLGAKKLADSGSGCAGGGCSGGGCGDSGCGGGGGCGGGD